MKSSIKIKLLLTIVIFLLAGFGLAEDKASISIQNSVTSSTITIGDKITYTLKVIHSPDIKVTMPSAGTNLGDFEIKDFQIYDSQKNKEGQIEEKQEFILTTFTTGDYIIPPVTVKYTTESQENKEIKSEQIFIKVASVSKSQAEQEDIRPDKLPLDEKLPLWFYYALGGLLSLTIVIIIYFYLRKRKESAKQEAIIPELPPYEWAKQRLSWLKEQQFLENNQVKEHYDNLSDCLRNYLERLFNLPLMDRTTTEIFLILKEEPRLRGYLTSINDFLKETDLIKFAKHVPEASLNENLWQTAENLIENLKPRINNNEGKT